MKRWIIPVFAFFAVVAGALAIGAAAAEDNNAAAMLIAAATGLALTALVLEERKK